MGILQGVDHLFTGKVERVDVELLQTLLDQGIIPVVPAARIRWRRQDLPGQLRQRGRRRCRGAEGDQADLHHRPRRAPCTTSIDPPDARWPTWKLSGQQKADSSLRNAFEGGHALRRAAGRRASGSTSSTAASTKGLLAEVFSNEGIGTLIYANEYQQIRPRHEEGRAHHPQMLTKNSVATDELVKRTRASIEKQLLGDYYIFEIDRNPVACVALHVYPEQKQGRTRLPLRQPSHENQGIGRKLIQFIEDQGARTGPGRAHRPVHPGLHLFPVQRRLRRRHPRRPAPEPTRKIDDQSGRNSKVLLES